MGKIKMIWDFRGPNALKTAEHHAKHLNEYITIENLKESHSGFEPLSELHAIAYMIVRESEVNALRVALKPHRGELFSES